MDAAGPPKGSLERVLNTRTPVESLSEIASEFWTRSAIPRDPQRRGKLVSGRMLREWGRLAGITEIVAPRLKRPAYIAPIKGGFRLALLARRSLPDAYERAVVRALEVDSAVRWWFAHEMGHTFFFDREQDPPRRVGPFDEAAEERLCQRFAAELLMPRERIGAERRLSVLRLLELSVVYGAPLRSVIRRCTEDLGVLPATCVLVEREIALSWSRRRARGRPLPQRGVEIFGHGVPTITAETVLWNPVVAHVCIERENTDSDELGVRCPDAEFVEGVVLERIAPKGACLFLFHSARPEPSEQASLFGDVQPK